MKECAPLPHYGHILLENQTEWFESSDVASLNYSLEHLQSYNARASQNQRFINLKRHLEFASTYKRI